jgi:hypothetical protein
MTEYQNLNNDYDLTLEFGKDAKPFYIAGPDDNFEGMAGLSFVKHAAANRS